jgi:hypothetical protein
LKPDAKREPNEDDSKAPFERRKTTDATHKDTLQIRILDQLQQWLDEETAELEASQESASEEEAQDIEWSKTTIFKRYRLAMNCVKNLTRLIANAEYFIGKKRDGEGEGEWEREDLDEIIVTLENESKLLTRLLSSLGHGSPEVEKYINEVQSWVQSVTTVLYGLEDSESSWDFEKTLSDKYNVASGKGNTGVDDEEDVEVEDDYENQPDEFTGYSDDEMDAMAYAGAEDFDPSDLDLASVTPRRLNEEGTRLNVFGKHPGYRKKPMSLPQTGSDKEGIYRDWNDDSVYSEQPFGQEIGDSTPFDSMVKASVDSIVESLKKKL